MGEAEKIIRETNENTKKSLQYLDAIYKKVAGNNKEINININKKVKDFRDMGVPSVIVDITPRQIYIMRESGWTEAQICAISGYSLAEAKKKYDSHVKRNVRV